MKIIELVGAVASNRRRPEKKRFSMQHPVISVMITLLLGVGPLAAETSKGQLVTAEVALALKQEQQASELAANGRTDEAEALYKQSLTTVEKSLPGDRILAGSLNNVGQFYRSQRRFSEAADLFNRSLAIYVPIYGDNHRLTATTIHNLAHTYLAQRRYDAAELLFKRGLAATEKLLGPDNYNVAISLDWLAQTNFFQGRYAEAEVHLRRGITVAEKSTGPNSPLVVSLLDHLSPVVKAEGRTPEAAAIKERAQQIVAATANSARAQAPQRNMAAVTLVSADSGLIGSTRIARPDIASQLALKFAVHEKMRMVELRTCPGISPDTVKDFMNELQRTGFIVAIDLKDPDPQLCVK